MVSVAPAAAFGASPDAPSLPFLRTEVGLGARFMPIGWFDLADPAGRSFRAFPALGGEAFADYRVSPAFSVGIAGEFTGNVIPNRSDYFVGTLWAASLRVGARYPTQGRFEPYGALTGGYSTISLSSGSSSARGALAGAWLGARLELGPRHRLFGQVGYEKGFQVRDGGDYAPSYVVTELGWTMGL